MAYKLITIEDSKQIAVNERKINEGEFYFTNGKIVKHILSSGYHTALVIIASNFYIDKSIAMWKDEVDTLLAQAGFLIADGDYERGYISGFKKGYKSSSKKWTDEQLRKLLLKMAQKCREQKDLVLKDYLNNIIPNSDEIIQSLQPQTIEFEMEREKEKKPCRVVGDRCAYGEEYCECKRPYFIKTTTDSEGQLWCNVIKIE